VKVTAARIEGDAVALALEDGEVVHAHRLALRDACLCPDCQNPVSGQRLFDSPATIRLASPVEARVSEGALCIVWRDGHRSVFGPEWLATEASALRDHARAPRPRMLWGAEIGRRLPVWRFDEVSEDPEARRSWLESLSAYGFALLRHAPVREDAVADVAELFGHVRVTNYGRVFDVRVRVDADNLADTAMALSLHTDNPYREPVPTLQLLHCLSSDVEGGETLLADGFRAVEQLGLNAPRLVEVLREVPIRYRYRDGSAELWADVPVVTLDSSGRAAALHVNNRSKGVPIGSPELVAEWYEAYFTLLDVLVAPDAKISFRLEPGDVVAFDNLRVLHGRTRFSGEGDRRLQGCYADRDGLYSSIALLTRSAAA